MADEKKIEDIHNHIVPYVYREFPRHVYKGAESKFVETAEALAEAEAQGWSKQPVVDEGEGASAEGEVGKPKPAAKPKPAVEPKKAEK